MEQGERAVLHRAESVWDIAHGTGRESSADVCGR